MMAGNRKPKKRYNPERARAAHERRLTTQVRTGIMAGPLLVDGVRGLQTFIHSSFEAIRTGAGTVEDLSNLELCAMLTTVICAAGIGRDDVAIGEDARVAVGSMVERYKTHKRVIFAGQEMAIIAQMLKLHDIQIEHEDMTKAKLITWLEASIVLLGEQGERYEKEAAGKLNPLAPA